jgi:hypothetical protein
MMMISYVVSEYMAVITCGIGVNVDTSSMTFVLETVRELVRGYIGAITGFLFHTCSYSLSPASSSPPP